MGITRGIITRASYIGIGLGVGLAFAVHSTNAAPPASLRPLASSPCNTSAPHGTYAVDPATGMTLRVSNLHVDKSTNQFAQPKAGHEFMIAHVLYHNGSKKAQDYNPVGELHLHGSNDQQNYDGAALDTSINVISPGTLAPGQSLAGDVAFEVPMTKQTYTLQWSAEYGQAPIIVPVNP